MSNTNTEQRFSKLAAYDDLFDRLLDPACLVSLENLEILDANSACERQLGGSLQYIKGLSLFNWLMEDTKVEFEKALRMVKRRHHPRQFEFNWKTTDGKILILDIVACQLSLSNDTTVIQLLFRDITRQKETERQAKQYLEDLKIVNEKLEALSTSDEMTKIANFRHFKSELQKEHLRAGRFNSPYSIIFFDVDHFKKYNDSNGHPAGDEVLRQFASLIKDTCRKTDLPARYGGEEFVILCQGVDWVAAKVLAERTRAQIQAHLFPHGEKQPLGRVTASIGVSSFPADGNTPEEVLQAADQALYHSKKNGRNQVTCFQEAPKLFEVRTFETLRA